MGLYKTLRPIALGGRLEAGSEIEMSEKHAANYPEGFLLKIGESEKTESPTGAEQNSDETVVNQSEGSSKDDSEDTTDEAEKVEGDAKNTAGDETSDEDSDEDLEDESGDEDDSEDTKLDPKKDGKKVKVRGKK